MILSKEEIFLRDPNFNKKKKKKKSKINLINQKKALNIL